MFKNIFRFLLFVVLLNAAGTGLYAQGLARVDLDGTKFKVVLTNFSVLPKGTGGNASWLKNEGKFYYGVMQAEIPENTFTQVEFRFTPLSSGTVYLWLKGPYARKTGETKNTPVFVFWDKVEVEGAEIKNGDFEDTSFWILGTNVPAQPDDAVFTKERVKSGNTSLRVWHDFSALQPLEVKANTPVVIRAWANQQK